MIDIQADVLAALRAVDTPTICNALELAAGTRSTSGFTLRPVVCADPGLPPVVGFARTARIRASSASTQCTWRSATIPRRTNCASTNSRASATPCSRFISRGIENSTSRAS